ncbi:MAG: hypothetical protein HYR60_24595, partial [Acidobacteria bacterium]|nr:hypothetical protein [Acidobacteriota bacterium]
LKGQCGAQRAEAPVEPPEGMVKLGWSLVAGGEVLPYSGVDCDQIARVAQSGAFQFPRNFRHVVYQRLAGRVVAHELVHVLLRTREHHATPLGRSPLNPASLGFDAALEPAEIAALRQLAKPGPERLIAGRGLFFGKPN